MVRLPDRDRATSSSGALLERTIPATLSHVSTYTSILRRALVGEARSEEWFELSFEVLTRCALALCVLLLLSCTYKPSPVVKGTAYSRNRSAASKQSEVISLFATSLSFTTLRSENHVLQQQSRQHTQQHQQ